MKKVVLSAALISLLTAGLIMNNRGLEVRDVLNENYTNEASGRLVKRKANEVANNNLSNVKAQISGVTERGTRHIRFVAALDSYLYDEVAFTITANNGSETRTMVDNERVTRVYTHVEASGKVLSASEAFGESYNYLVAFTINNVPENAWDYTFTATVTARAEGYNESVSKSAERVISQMINNEMTKEVPTLTYDTATGINAGSIENVFDGDNSTYLWFAGTPSYIDFTFTKETYIDSLEITFKDGNKDQYGNDLRDSLASPPNISYYDAATDSFVDLGGIENNAWSLKLNTNLDSITTSKIRLTGPHRAWVSISEFRYNFDDNVTLSGNHAYYRGSSLSLFDNNPDTRLWINGGMEENGYIDIDLEENTRLKTLEISTYEAGSGLPRVQYLADNGEYVTISENATSGCRLDLRNQEIYTNRLRLTTLEGQGFGEWPHYRDIVINGLADEAPLFRIEGSSQRVWSGTSFDVLDGDDSTFLWTDFSPRANDAFIFTYPNAITLKNLYVDYHTGVDEVCSYDKIAYRLDGSEEWVDLDVTFGPEQKTLFLDLSENAVENVKEIKLYTSKDMIVSPGLATFDVNYGAVCSPRLGEWDNGNLPFNEGRFVSKVFDRNDSTYYWFNSHIEGDESLTVDLGQVRRVVSLNVLMKDGNNGSAHFANVEYSEDGVNWSNKIHQGSNELTYNFDRITNVRYVRFSGGLGIWPSMASLSITAPNF